MRTRRAYWVLGAILLVAAVTRLYRPDWYGDRQFHPDERWIFQQVSGLSYPEEPERLQYGTLPMYLLSTLRQVAQALDQRLDVGRFLLVGGRTLTGLLDVACVAASFFLGRAAFGTAVGLLGAAFLSVTVLHISLSRFFAVDVPAALLVTLCLWAAVLVARGRSLAASLCAGIAFGLALACKSSALPLGVALVAAHVIAPPPARTHRGRARRRTPQHPLAARLRDPSLWSHLGLCLFACLVAFGAAMPHAFLDYDRFLDDQNEERRKLVTGQDDVPFTRQYAGTLPFLFYIENLVRWTQFYPLGLLSLAAVAASAAAGLRALRPGNRALAGSAGHLVLSTWVWSYLAVVGASFAKFNRYMLLLTPVFAVLSAELLRRLALAWAERRGTAKPPRSVARGFAAAAMCVLVPTAVYAAGFLSIYLRPHTWIASSKWIAGQVRASTRPLVVLNEEWGDDLPVHVEGLPHANYRSIRWAVQEPDLADGRLNERKLSELSSMLAQADLVAWADRRAYGTYLRLPRRYPLNYGYYTTMLREPARLGFERAAEFASRPRFLLWTLDDDRADESFTLFDHPHVYLFRVLGRRTPEELSAALRAEAERVRAAP